MSILALLALVVGTLPGCTNMLANLPGVGLPPGTPERPAVPPPFPAVHDMPAPRETKPLSEAERKRLEAELNALRERQGRSGGRALPARKKSKSTTAD
jgi:hypothetical protein